MSIRLSYVVAGIAGAVMALSVRYYSLVTENSSTRLEVFEYQQKLESVQSQIQAKRETIELQQDKLSKSSSFGDSIGPAIVTDIATAAVKGNNSRLRELLQKRGMSQALSAADHEQSALPVRKGAK
jgi:uncharacterized protein YwlG (UPF0340 family)